MKYGEAAKVIGQQTLKTPIHCSGVGLHSGARTTMTLRPADAGTGIVFARTDLPGGARVAATWKTAVETPLCTSIENRDGVRVATVEHLMSALHGCGIDNAVIDLDGPEVPAMDGSASPFVFLIECAGRVEQALPRRALRILKPVAIREPERSVSLSPGDGLSIDFEIDFDSRAVARQRWFVTLDPGTYKREIARARTFGFLHEVARLRAMELIRGGSLDNAVVIDGDRILNEGGLRFADEFVRHKVLDMIGDLYLAGGAVIGHARCVHGGHGLTLRLLKALFAQPDAWCWTQTTEQRPYSRPDAEAEMEPRPQAVNA